MLSTYILSENSILKKRYLESSKYFVKTQKSIRIQTRLQKGVLLQCVETFVAIYKEIITDLILSFHNSCNLQ